MKANQEHAKKVYEILEQQFPNAKCALNFANKWQLLAATILSAQSTDIRVNQVTVELFSKYGEVNLMAEADIEDVKKIIKPVGFFNQKAKFLTNTAKKIISDYHGVVPGKLSELIKLPGVARKTANVVLGVGFGVNEGIVVDTHVKRLSLRLGLSKANTPESIEQDLMKLYDQSLWEQISTLLIHHGRKTCVARKPHCKKCPLKGICPATNLED